MLTGWKTLIGMVLVILGQVCLLLTAKVPGLDAVGQALIDIGTAIGAVGVTARVVRETRSVE